MNEWISININENENESNINIQTIKNMLNYAILPNI